eukprot:s1283_g11.t1
MGLTIQTWLASLGGPARAMVWRLLWLGEAAWTVVAAGLVKMLTAPTAPECLLSREVAVDLCTCWTQAATIWHTPFGGRAAELLSSSRGWYSLGRALSRRLAALRGPSALLYRSGRRVQG